MGDITRIDAASAVEITDGISQSVAVGTGVPTGTEAALMTREARKGQTTMASSIPVVLSSDQSVGRSSFATAQTSVGVAAVQLGSNAATLSVTVKSHNGNTGTIYLGVSGVTTSTGFELGPGESLSLAVDNANRIYVISDTASQTVSVIAI